MIQAQKRLKETKEPKWDRAWMAEGEAKEEMGLLVYVQDPGLRTSRATT